MKELSTMFTEVMADMMIKAMIKMMWVNTIQNCFAIGCCTALAIAFDKWWLMFIALFFWKNINPVEMMTSVGENKKK